jgi:uncharacterized YigZ family protein
METSHDHYFTIAKNTLAVLYKDRGSKFFGYAFKVTNETQIKARLDELRAKDPSANHHCYAWLLGPNDEAYRVNDDGEPSNSAGNPILGQIRSQGLHNVLVVVVRYFGGTKLGVGGLIQAYRTTAAQVLERAGIKKVWITERVEVRCAYDQLNRVMRVVKRDKLTVVSQELTTSCLLVLQLKKGKGQAVVDSLTALKGIEARLI